ncbi:hypothetical protein E4U13_006642 [Claviceps humidiphila]|uniref:Uncharacterized protein n=1 Tax=Claviceps humidiphila TaxID=1294629 RepID=A0A9P7PWC0_9HYPO|nr:hypothetical protein E4U13_006642 [Claviceps humidiphila]
MKPSSLSPSPSSPPPFRHATATPPGHRSPTPLPPLPAHILAAQEVRRRNALRERGPCRSGCGDLDSHVLRGGGFERGCVVGVSAEEEGVGMALGLQVLSRELLDCPDSRALIITPRPAAEVLRSLRESLVAQQQQQTGGGCSLGHCLERVMLSCVFDMDGLWEVLSDLSDAEADAEPDDSHKGGQRHEMQRQTQTQTKGKGKGKGKEIQDSQDEEETLSTPLDDTATTNNNNTTITTITNNTTPSFILITHFSTLLSGLFAQRERQAAHSTVSLLSARLNYLSRNLPPNPLIMILNSVTESPGTTPARPHQTRTRTRTRNGIQADAKPTKTKLTPSTALDPSLQSIFSAPPPLDIPGYHYAGNLPRRLKPSFGLVFTQLLDLHLLCSQVARTRAHDGLPGLQDGEGDAGGVVTVVEVLMDEMGVWQGRRGVRPRREQRWTAVDVVKGRVCCAM